MATIGHPAARRVLWLGFAAIALIALTLAGRPVAAIGPADVAITKTGPNLAAPNSDVAYTITVTNNGPNDATNVSWTDTLPDSSPSGSPMTFVSLTQGSGPTFTLTNPGPGNSNTASGTIGTLANGASQTFTFTLHIPPGTPNSTSYTNTATVSASNDSTPLNNNSSVTTTVPDSADVTITKSGPDFPAANSNFAYTITVTNNGLGSATNVAWSDTLPNSTAPSGFPLTFVSLTQGSGPTFTLTNPGPGNSNTASGTIGTLANGASQTFTLTVHIPNGTPNGTQYSNIANVSADNDPNTENNEGFALTTVSGPPPSADVTITKTGPQFAAPNTDIAYTITVKNLGPDPATTVAWSDQLPNSAPPGSPMTFVSLTQGSGPTFATSDPGVGNTGTVSGTIATLTSGTSATFTLTLHIPPGTPTGSQYTNIATITSDHDPNDENNESPAVTTVASADIGVTKSGPPTVIAGQTISYTISISNSGPDAAPSATWTDTLPAGETFVSLTKNTGPTFSQTTPAVGSGGTVSATTTFLANGASAQFTLVVLVAPGTANGTIVTNTVSGSAQALDTNANNDQSSTQVTVSTQADLAVTKTGPTNVVSDTDVTYTITVTNNGPSDAATVSMSDTLPTGTTFVSATQASGPTFSVTNPTAGGTGTVNATIAALANGASAQFTLVLHVAPRTVDGGTLANTATVSTATTDPGSGNNTTTANATVARPTAAVTAISRADASPTGADTVHWTVTFNTAVNGVTGSNFQLATTGLGGTPAITAVAPVGAAPSATWSVTASTGTGSGMLRLDLVNDTNLDHSISSNLPFHGEVYTIDRNPGTITAVGGTPQSAAVSTPFGAPLQAKVVNAENQPLAGVLVTFTVNPVGGAAATLSSATATTDTSGVASVSATANLTKGQYTVTANVTPPLATAASFSLTNTAALVSIAVSPANGTLKVGQTQQFTAMGTYQDGNTQNLTNQVTWSSDAPSVAMVDASGKVTGQAPGTAHIKATQGSVSGQTGVTVSAPTPIGIAPAPAPASRPGVANEPSGTPAVAPSGTGRSGTTGGTAPAPAPGGR